MSGPRKADRWRTLLKIDEGARREIGPGGGLESIEPQTGPSERIEVAREAMVRQIEDRFGGDPALLKAVEELVITSEEAIEILDSQADAEPSADQFASLEAIVMFDGTRPSFLIKDHQIDFASSFNTGDWQNDLQPHLNALKNTLSCIGRVELGERHIGTAFLVTPTLAITNRHVAQSIARFERDQIVLKPDTFLDFGREQWNGKASFDRRGVESIVFAGSAPVAAPIDHKKLDLAVLRASESKLEGDQRNRSLSASSIDLDEYLAAGIVAAAGYPASPELYVPGSLKSKYDNVLKKLLEGEGGAKRFAPGKPSDFKGDSDPAGWTVCHDATTINGNSGSPLLMLGRRGEPEHVTVIGLHYGGDWGGERTNWAHRLSATGGATGFATALTFSEFCRAEGIAL
jgi:V8-like Glu-specific endopeptidase